MHQIDAQVAQTNEQRATGLMWRKQMPQHEGMLFAFELPSRQCFWMKDTLLPLSAAFIDDDGTIVNIADMQPRSLDSHCSAKPVRYVLEMNQGWFDKKGIKARRQALRAAVQIAIGFFPSRAAAPRTRAASAALVSCWSEADP